MGCVVKRLCLAMVAAEENGANFLLAGNMEPDTYMNVSLGEGAGEHYVKTDWMWSVVQKPMRDSKIIAKV